MANQAGKARQFWIVGGAAAVIGVVSMIALDYPPGLQDTAGTIVPAKRFRADGGGTSILGGIGGYTGTILGALILTVLNRLLLTLDTTEAFRQILYGLIVLALAWVYVRITGQRGT